MKNWYNVTLISRTTGVILLLLLGENEEDAKREGWIWIHKHGFKKMFIADAKPAIKTEQTALF